MDFDWEKLLFYILLIDAVGVNLVAWSTTPRWWHKHLGVAARHFPLARGWTTYYLMLVIFIGYLLFDSGHI